MKNACNLQLHVYIQQAKANFHSKQKFTAHDSKDIAYK